MPKDTKGSNENSTDDYVVIPEEMKKFDRGERGKLKGLILKEYGE